MEMDPPIVVEVPLSDGTVTPANQDSCPLTDTLDPKRAIPDDEIAFPILQLPRIDVPVITPALRIPDITEEGPKILSGPLKDVQPFEIKFPYVDNIFPATHALLDDMHVFTQRFPTTDIYEPNTPTPAVETLDPSIDLSRILNPL
jgi:hypothetical protein